MLSNLKRVLALTLFLTSLFGYSQVGDFSNLYTTGFVIHEGTGYLRFPIGTTGERPVSPTFAMIRGNTTTGKTEVYEGGEWKDVVTSSISLLDPGADRLLGWDDSEGDLSYFSIGTGLSFSTTTLTLHPSLQSISGLTTVADRMIYTTASDAYAVTTLTSFARSLLDDIDAATARTTLDVDQAGTDNSTNVTLTGSLDYITISGQEITRDSVNLTTDVNGILATSKGGTGQTTYANGELLIGNGVTNSLSKSTLTIGTGLGIANTAGNITIDAVLADEINIGVARFATDIEMNSSTANVAVSPETILQWTGSGALTNFDKTGNWTGTFDGQEGTYYLDWSNFTNTPTTLSGYGITDAVPSTRSITLNGTINEVSIVGGTQDLSANRSWTIGLPDSVSISAVNATNVYGDTISISAQNTSSISAMIKAIDISDSGSTPIMVFQSGESTINNRKLFEWRNNTTPVGEVDAGGGWYAYGPFQADGNISSVSGNLSIGGNGDFLGTEAVRLVNGTTAQRPSIGANGDMRYNTSLSKFEVYENGSWKNIINASASLNTNEIAYADASGDLVGSGTFTFNGGLLTVGNISLGSIRTITGLSGSSVSLSSGGTGDTDIRSGASGNIIFRGGTILRAQMNGLTGTWDYQDNDQINVDSIDANTVVTQSLFTPQITNSSGDITVTPNASNHLNISSGGLEIGGTQAISSGRAGSFTTGSFSGDVDIQRSVSGPNSLFLNNSNAGAGAYDVIRLGANTTAAVGLGIHHMGSNYTASGLYVADASVIAGYESPGLRIASANASGALSFYTGGSGTGNLRMTINSSGDVGIGTSSPAKRLSVISASGSENYPVSWERSGGTRGYLYGDNGGVGITNADPFSGGSLFYLAGSKMQFYFNGTQKAVIDSSGNVITSGDLTADSVFASNIPLDFETTLTASQINNSGTTPITLIPAPGAGNYIVVLRVEFSIDFNTTAYTLGTSGPEIRYSGGNLAANDVTFIRNVLVATSDAAAGSDGTEAILYGINEAVRFDSNGDDHSLGNSSGKIHIWYVIRSI